MSKRPSSERDLGEDEAEDLGLQNDIRRMRLDGEDNEQGSNVAAAASSQISGVQASAAMYIRIWVDQWLSHK